jgi:hypothetical protein
VLLLSLDFGYFGQNERIQKTEKDKIKNLLILKAQSLLSKFFMPMLGMTNHPEYYLNEDYKVILEIFPMDYH